MHDAADNIERIRKGLLSILGGKSIDFTNDLAPLVAVFADPVGRHSGGRVMLFQHFFSDRLGFYPEIVRQVPACLKIFFKVGSLDGRDADAFEKLLASDEFRTVCEDLNISQVQFGSKFIIK